MRFRTVKRKLRKAGLPTFYVGKVFEAMQGYSDEDALFGGSANDIWIKVVASVMKDYLDSLKKETQSLRSEIA